MAKAKAKLVEGTRLRIVTSEKGSDGKWYDHPIGFADVKSTQKGEAFLAIKFNSAPMDRFGKGWQLKEKESE